MSVMVIRPERGCDDIHALIDHVLSDGAGCTEADFPDSEEEDPFSPPHNNRKYQKIPLLSASTAVDGPTGIPRTSGTGDECGCPFSGKHDELDYRQPGLWKVHSPINQHDVAEKLRSEVSE